MPIKQRNQIIYRDDILQLLIDVSKLEQNKIIVYDVNVVGEGSLVAELYSKDIRIDNVTMYSSYVPVLFGVGSYTDTWRFIFDDSFKFPENFTTMDKTSRDNYWDSIPNEKGLISSAFRVFPDIYDKVKYTVLANLTFNMAPHYFYLNSRVYARVKIGLGRPMSRDDMRYQYEMIKRGLMTYNIYRVCDQGNSSRWVCEGSCQPIDDFSYGFIIDTTSESLLNIPGTYFAKISLQTSDGQTLESPRMSFNVFNDNQAGTLVKKCCG